MKKSSFPRVEITRKNQIHKKKNTEKLLPSIERDYLNSVCYQVCAWNVNNIKEEEKK